MNGDRQFFEVQVHPRNRFSFDFNNVTYAPGSWFWTDNACEFIDFYEAFRKKFREEVSTDVSVERNEAVPATLERARRHCKNRSNQRANPNAQTDSLATQSDDLQTDFEQPLPGREDSPEALGSPTGEPILQGNNPGPDASPVNGDLPNGEAHPDHSRPQTDNPAESGDPVLLHSGQFEIRELDLELPGVGVNIRFARTYRSGPLYDGSLGYNWDHDANQFLRELDDASVAHWTGHLREHLYFPNGKGGFDPQVGVHRRLVRETPGPGTVRYRLIEPGGNTSIFERPPGWSDPQRIPLIRFEDRHGNAITYGYDGENRLRRMADGFGRMLELDYGDCGMLERLRDHTGRRWLFLHDYEAKRLVAAYHPTVDGSSDGVGKHYSYAENEVSLTGRALITVVHDEDGRVVVDNEYDRPDLLGHQRVIRQYVEGVYYQYTYDTITWAPPRPETVNIAMTRVQVHREGDGLRVYDFNPLGQMIEERFRLAADRSYRIVRFRYRYDNAGNRIWTQAPDGLREVRDFDNASADPTARSNLLQLRLVPPAFTGVPERRIMRAIYEPRFQLVRSLEEEGVAVTRYRYDHDLLVGGTGRLLAVEYPDVTRPDGSMLSATDRFERDTLGRITRALTAAGQELRYTYHGAGGGNGLVETVRHDSQPAHLTYAYDAAGRMNAVTDGRGSTVGFTHDARDRTIAVLLPDVGDGPRERRFEFDGAGHLVRDIQPVGETADPTLSIERSFCYDSAGRAVETRLDQPGSGAQPRVWRYAYSASGQVNRVDDPLGRRTRYCYDERGLLIRERQAAGMTEERTIRFGYDRLGRQVSMHDGTFQSQTSYDSFGRPAVRQQASGTESRLSYGANGALQRREVWGRPAPGQALRRLRGETLAYNARNQLIRVTRDAFVDAGNPMSGWEMDYDLDADGRVVWQRDHRGLVTRFTYGALGLMTRAEDSLGNASAVRHDAVGNVLDVTEIEALPDATTVSAVTRFEYDARNRQVAVVDPLGNRHTSGFDDGNRLVRQTDPSGHMTRYAYDMDSSLTALVQRSDSPMDQLTQTYTYDTAGRLTGWVDADGRQTQLTLDALNRVTAQTLPDGVTTRWLYHDTTQVVRRTVRPDGRVFESKHSTDLLTRTLGVFDDQGVELGRKIFEHDGLGRLVRATEGNQSVERDWDSLNRLVAERSVAGETRFAYDDVARQVDRTTEFGRRDRFFHDTLGRVERIQLVGGAQSGFADGSDLVRIRYHGKGRIASYDLAGGVRSTFGFDAALRVNAIDHFDAAGQVVASIRYVHDATGRRRAETALPAPFGDRLYGYDSQYRLAAVDRDVGLPTIPKFADQAATDAWLAALQPGAPGAGSERFEYDNVGNLTEARQVGIPGAQVTSFALTSGYQIASANGTPFVYETGGNLLTDGTRSYVYDGFGRLTEVADAAGNVLSHRDYDPLDRPISESAAGRMIQRLFVGDDLIALEEQGGLRSEFMLGERDAPLLVSRGGSDLWHHLDANETLRATTDGAGAVKQRFVWSAYGRLTDVQTATPAAQGEPEPCLVYAGHPVIREVGLVDMQTRVYNPETATFLQPDPTGFPDGPGNYAYVSGDPVNLTDPSGTCVPDAGSCGETTTETGGKKREKHWYDWILGPVSGAIASVTETFEEAGKQVVDMIALGGQVMGDATGMWEYDWDPVSNVGRAAERGMGTGELLWESAKSMAKTPVRMVDAIAEDDPFAFGKASGEMAQMFVGGKGTWKAKLRGNKPPAKVPAALPEPHPLPPALPPVQQRWRLSSGEHGVGVLWVKDASKLTPDALSRIQSVVRDADFQAAFQGGVVRQRVSKTMRSTGNKWAHITKRKDMEIVGPGQSPGHVLDIAAGFDPVGVIIGMERSVNRSWGGQWRRYKPGAVFEGFSLYDKASGRPLYTSGALEHMPPSPFNQ